MSKHTPGPWKVDGTYIYEVEQDKIIAEVETYNNDELPYQANARLMAAAPEMFECLDAIMGFDSKANYRARRRAYDLLKELKKP